ncbi:MAG: ATP-binding cassette domain-containing protein, partial [Anaerolineae bacterium]|nr:ATP-binding cassette domain-containing protein [Anaerolineae bacterium]
MTVIRVEGLYKQYGLPLPSPFSRLRGLTEPKWSLRDIQFEVRGGETLGIIGYNGAGKSTLLKVLAGVTPPTRGQVEVRGRVFPMIELNAGMNMELTGRENVLLLGILMGMSRAEIRAKLPEIEDFCELGKWFDEAVWKYSSGMLARLGFSVALNVDADILLVDEVLAV